ncbi:MAG: TadE family protein [Planctomycetota bacterium]|nr:TadE family protein [Planctomycetota bacterium]
MNSTPRRRRIRWGRFAGGLAAAALGVYAMRFNEEVAQALTMPVTAGGLVFLLGAALTIAALSISGSRLLLEGLGAARAARELGGCARGTVMVEFTLVFPLVLLIMVCIVQVAMLAAASLVVRYAAFVGARTGCVTLDRDGVIGIEEDFENEPQRIVDAVRLVLSPISPQSPRNLGYDPSASVMNDIVSRAGRPHGSRSAGLRKAYTLEGASVSYSSSYPPADLFFFDLPNLFAPKEVEVRVSYDYYIIFPGINLVPWATVPARSGLPGRAFPIRQTVRLQSTGGRISSPAALAGGLPLL